MMSNWGFFATMLASLGIVLPLLNDFHLLNIKSEKRKRILRFVIFIVSVISLPVIWEDYYATEKSQKDTNLKLTSIKEENKALQLKVSELQKLNNVSEKRISLLKAENELLNTKVIRIDETISSMSIEYEVVMRLSSTRKIFSSTTIMGPDTPYAMLNSSSKFVSSGLSFSFFDFGNGFLLFRCKAEIKNGELPIGQNKKYLKKVKYIQFLVPFLELYNLTESERSVAIQSLKLSFFINGFKSKEIFENYQNRTHLIRNDIFQGSSVNFLNFDYWFKSNLYDELIGIPKR